MGLHSSGFNLPGVGGFAPDGLRLVLFQEELFLCRLLSTSIESTYPIRHASPRSAGPLVRCAQPGDVVLDLGSGTGILGLLACRAGAKRVYSIDEGGMVGLARQICQATACRTELYLSRDCPLGLTCRRRWMSLSQTRSATSASMLACWNILAMPGNVFKTPAAQWCHAVLNCWRRQLNHRRCGTRLSFGIIHRQGLTSVRRDLWRQIRVIRQISG